jgi:uncharacterized tellurite resistance protein B-like protein
MIKRLLSLFELPPAQPGESLEHHLNLAAAALLIETARADFTQDRVEEEALRELLVSTLGLAREEIDDLLLLANDAVDEATSLYQFTRVINDHYDAAQKLQLVRAMWRVAYADGNLDKYEEHLIRRVAELTYVPHEDYIGAKLAARP